MLAIHNELGLRPFLTVHDSLSYLVPGGDAKAAAARMLEIAHRTPVWWPKGAPPIAAEAKIGTRYGFPKVPEPEAVSHG
jgi:hypothetical protein